MRGHLTLPVVAAFVAGTASADIIWDEAIHGDLSDNNLDPTPLTLGIGENIIMGTVGPSAEDDFFVFTLPGGWTLEQVIVLAYSSGTNQTFLGVNLGPTYEPLTNADCFGYTFFGQAHIGSDVLPAMGASNGNFTPPLPDGQYSWWIDEGTGPETYSLNFVVVPSPAALVLLGLAGLSQRRRRA